MGTDSGFPNPHNGMFSGYDGLITAPVCRKMRDVTDGTSNTILVGEFNWQLNDYLWSAWSCAGNPALQGTPRYGAHRWAVGYPATSPGDTSGDYNTNTFANRTTWRSDHPGGAHFLLVDGSVHFVGESIDAALLDNLANRSDGEALGEF